MRSFLSSSLSRESSPGGIRDTGKAVFFTISDFLTTLTCPPGAASLSSVAVSPTRVPTTEPPPFNVT